MTIKNRTAKRLGLWSAVLIATLLSWTVTLQLIIKSTDITADDLDKVILLSEETYCPVWSMIKGNVEVTVTYNIVS